MQVKPLGNRVLIKPVKEEEITASGIVLPESVEKEKKTQGEVVAIGPGKLLENGSRSAMEVAIGDMVIFEKWGGEDIDIDGEPHKIISQDAILAVIS